MKTTIFLIHNPDLTHLLDAVQQIPKKHILLDFVQQTHQEHICQKLSSKLLTRKQFCHAVLKEHINICKMLSSNLKFPRNTFAKCCPANSCPKIKSAMLSRRHMFVASSKFHTQGTKLLVVSSKSPGTHLPNTCCLTIS